MACLAVRQSFAFDENRPRPGKPATKPPAAAGLESIVPLDTVRTADTTTDTTLAPASASATRRGSGSPQRPDALPHRKTAAYELVRVGQNVRVNADEVVRGDVVLVGGNLRVDGEILGGAVVLGGDIDVGPTARIHGGAVAVAGRANSAPGSEVRGGAVSLSVFSTPVLERFAWPRARQVGELLSDCIKLVLLIVLAVPVCALLAPRLDDARATFDATPFTCIGLGLLTLPGGIFTAIVVAFLLALTLVGVPVALLLLVAALLTVVIAMQVGAALVGVRAAQWLRRAQPAHVSRRSVWSSVVLGLVCLRIPELCGDLLRIASPAGRWAVGFEAADVAVEIAVIAGGLGALVLWRWSGRPKAPGTLVAPARG
jgi:hypothetical protein